MNRLEWFRQSRRGVTARRSRHGGT